MKTLFVMVVAAVLVAYVIKGFEKVEGWYYEWQADRNSVITFPEWQEPDTSTAEYKAKQLALSLMPDIFYNYGKETIAGVPLVAADMETRIVDMERRGANSVTVNRWMEISRDKTPIISADFIEAHKDKKDSSKRNMWFNVVVQDPHKHRYGSKDASSLISFQIMFVFDASDEKSKDWLLDNVFFKLIPFVYPKMQDVYTSRKKPRGFLFRGKDVYLNQEIFNGEWHGTYFDLTEESERLKPLFYNKRDFSPRKYYFKSALQPTL